MSYAKKSIFIYIVFFLLILLVFTQKDNYFVDELWSYGLANSEQQTVMDIIDGKTYENPEEPFLEYLTVNEDTKFDYDHVWENQRRDNHPVLYYLVLHTICSFFPGKFSVLFGAAINLCFAMVLLLFLRKLILLMTHSRKIQTILSIAFILLYGTLNAMGFIRMYVMLMCWAVMLSYLVLRILDKARERSVPAGLNDHPIWYLYFCAFAVTLCGALTQYYFIVFAVALTLTATILLLVEKDWKNAGILAGSEVGGGLMALLIFPTMLEHVFGHDRGTQSMENLAESAGDFEALRTFWTFLNREVFGGWMLFALGMAAVAGVLYYASHRAEDDLSVSWSYYIVLLVPVVVYFLIIGVTAPLLVNRYIYLIYPIVFVMVFSLLSTMLAYLFHNKLKLVPIVMTAVMALTVVSSYIANADVLFPYLYKDSPENFETVQEYKDCDALCLYRYDFQKLPVFLEAQQFKSITFVQADKVALLDDIDICKNDKLILINVDEREGDYYVSRVFRHCPQFTKCETLFEAHLAAETCILY